MLKNNAEAEEASQDSFMKMYNSVGRLELQSKLSTWLYKITYRTCLDYIRKRKRTIDLDNAAETVSEDQGVDAKLEMSDEKKLLEDAISELGSADATIVNMFYFEDMGIEELAEVTGMTKSNIKIKLFRSRKKLKEIIEDKYHSLKPNTLHG